MTLFTLGVSTETSVFNEASGSARWVAQSRFSVGILKKIFTTNQILPFRTTFLAVIMIVLTSLLLCKTLNSVTGKKNKSIANDIMSILFVTMPIAAHYMYYLTYNFEIGIGMFITILSVYCFNKTILFKESKLYTIIGVICLFTSIGEYQSFVAFYILIQVATLLIYYMYNDIKFREKVIMIAKYIALLIISLIIYFIVSKIFLIFIEEEKYSQGFFLWGKSEVSAIISNLKEYFLDIYVNRNVYGMMIVTPTCIIAIILAVILVFKKKFLEALMLLFMLITPMLLPIATGSKMPYRTQQAIMALIPIIWYIVTIFFDKVMVQKAIYIVAFLAAMRQSMYINKLFYSDYLRYQNDVNLCRRISDRIYDLDLKDLENYTVVYLGKQETKEIPNLIRQELIGYSIFEWDGGNYKRIQNFMTLTTAKFKIVTSPETITRAKELSQDMPVWPDKGSIAVKEDMIVVKLSE